MLVLLTRALDEAARTAAKLAANGHRAILSPVLEMVPTGAEWPAGVIDGVLATSAQAFELFSDAPDWPLPEARRLLPLFLVGQRTQETASERGFEGCAVIAPHAKALAASANASVAAASRLVYLAGRDRKPDLEATLTGAGHKLEVMEVYAAQPADSLGDEAVASIEARQVGAILHYSRRSAEIFLQLARQAGLDVANLVHVAISSDAARPLRVAKIDDVHVAEHPNEQAMLALVDLLTSKTLYARTAAPNLD
jgi:uroporphyrinogen-III synthase